MRPRLNGAWAVPFAYPRAAEIHAQSLLGEVPDRPYALLVTAEPAT